jgi:hypothetical protein
MPIRWSDKPESINALRKSSKLYDETGATFAAWTIDQIRQAVEWDESKKSALVFAAGRARRNLLTIVGKLQTEGIKVDVTESELNTFLAEAGWKAEWAVDLLFSSSTFRLSLAPCHLTTLYMASVALERDHVCSLEKIARVLMPWHVKNVPPSLDPEPDEENLVYRMLHAARCSSDVLDSDSFPATDLEPGTKHRAKRCRF